MSGRAVELDTFGPSRATPIRDAETALSVCFEDRERASVRFVAILLAEGISPIVCRFSSCSVKLHISRK